MIKVVHVITGLGMGGAEKMLYELLKVTHGISCDATVISLKDEGVYGEKIKSLGVKVISLGMSKSLSAVRSIFLLRKHIASIGPDVIHAWMYHSALAVYLSGVKVATVWGVHHSLADISNEKFSLRLVIRLLKWVSAQPKRILYCSDASRRQHIELGYPKETSLLIPNGFDCEFYKNTEVGKVYWKSKLGFLADGFLVGHVGRFHPMKDHRCFLEAAKIFLDDGAAGFFVLVGPGVDSRNEELLGMIEGLGLADRVKLLGSRGDVHEIINAMDILSTSSAYGEAFPMILGEAMASGIPCVATDVGDSALLIGDDRFVVPPKSPRLLSNAWMSIYRLPIEKRDEIGEDCRKRILENYSISNVASMHLAAYSICNSIPG